MQDSTLLREQALNTIGGRDVLRVKTGQRLVIYAGAERRDEGGARNRESTESEVP
jgi:hypothetical protein